MTSNSNVLDVLIERGFVKDVSDAEGLRKQLARPTAVYCGYDATAQSYHVGNAVSMMMLAWLQRYGHQPIAVMGGGTTMVGDPSGKTRDRPILSRLDIEANVERLRPQLGCFIDFAAGGILVDNSGWLLNLNLLEFLRDVGSRFTVNHMLSHETYRIRLEQGGLSFLEFSYQLLQAYDFLHLFQENNCRFQIGGSDQWANILAGVDLIRRVEAKEAFALVCPLVTTASGAKMGKTEQGAVWLSADLLSPFDYYQYWINVSDADVERFLALFTFLPMEQVHQMGQLEGAELRRAKEVLALEATAIVHGRERAMDARDAAQSLFAGAGSSASVPSASVPITRLTNGVDIISLLTDVGMVQSRREGRRLVDQGGLTLNGKVISSAEFIVTADHVDSEDGLLLRAGKKRFMRIRATA